MKRTSTLWGLRCGVLTSRDRMWDSAVQHSSLTWTISTAITCSIHGLINTTIFFSALHKTSVFNQHLKHHIHLLRLFVAWESKILHYTVSEFISWSTIMQLTGAFIKQAKIINLTSHALMYTSVIHTAINYMSRTPCTAVSWVGYVSMCFWKFYPNKLFTLVPRCQKFEGRNSLISTKIMCKIPLNGIHFCHNSSQLQPWTLTH